MKSYEDWSVEELDAEIIRLQTERAEIKQRQLALTAIRDRKVSEEPTRPSQAIDVGFASASAEIPPTKDGE